MIVVKNKDVELKFYGEELASNTRRGTEYVLYKTRKDLLVCVSTIRRGQQEEGFVSWMICSTREELADFLGRDSLGMIELWVKSGFRF